MSKVNAIWAESLNKVIGSNGSIPWSVPEDLNFFKEQTMGKTLLMGRKTFNSIPLLKGRKMIVLTKKVRNVINDDKYQENFRNIEIVKNYDEAIERINRLDEVWIIGGGEIYELFLPITDKVVVTTVDTIITGEDLTFAPNLKDFEKVSENSWKVSKSGLRWKLSCFYRNNVL